MFRPKPDFFQQADYITKIITYLQSYNLNTSQFELRQAATLLVKAMDDQTYLNSLSLLIEAEDYCNIGPLGNALKAQIYFELDEKKELQHHQAPSISITDFYLKSEEFINQYLNLVEEQLRLKQYKHAQHYLSQAMLIGMSVIKPSDNYDWSRFFSLLTPVQQSIAKGLESLKLAPEILNKVQSLNSVIQEQPHNAEYYFALVGHLSQKIPSAEINKIVSIGAWLIVTDLHQSPSKAFNIDLFELTEYCNRNFSEFLSIKYKLQIQKNRKTLQNVFKDLNFKDIFTYDHFFNMIVNDLSAIENKLYVHGQHDELLKQFFKRCDLLHQSRLSADQFAEYVKDFLDKLTLLPPVFALIAAHVFLEKNNIEQANKIIKKAKASSDNYTNTHHVIINAISYIEFNCEFNLAKKRKNIGIEKYAAAVACLLEVMWMDITELTLNTVGIQKVLKLITDLMKETHPPISGEIARLDLAAAQNIYFNESNIGSQSIERRVMLLNQIILLNPLDSAYYYYRSQHRYKKSFLGSSFEIIYLCVAAMLHNAEIDKNINPNVSIINYYQGLKDIFRFNKSTVDEKFIDELISLIPRSVKPIVKEKIINASSSSAAVVNSLAPASTVTKQASQSGNTRVSAVSKELNQSATEEKLSSQTTPASIVSKQPEQSVVKEKAVAVSDKVSVINELTTAKTEKNKKKKKKKKDKDKNDKQAAVVEKSIDTPAHVNEVDSNIEDETLDARLSEIDKRQNEKRQIEEQKQIALSTAKLLNALAEKAATKSLIVAKLQHRIDLQNKSEEKVELMPTKQPLLTSNNPEQIDKSLRAIFGYFEYCAIPKKADVDLMRALRNEISACENKDDLYKILKRFEKMPHFVIYIVTMNKLAEFKCFYDLAVFYDLLLNLSNKITYTILNEQTHQEVIKIAAKNDLYNLAHKAFSLLKKLDKVNSATDKLYKRLLRKEADLTSSSTPLTSSIPHPIETTQQAFAVPVASPQIDHVSVVESSAIPVSEEQKLNEVVEVSASSDSAEEQHAPIIVERSITPEPIEPCLASNNVNHYFPAQQVRPVTSPEQMSSNESSRGVATYFSAPIPSSQFNFIVCAQQFSSNPIDIAQYGVGMMKYNLKIELNMRDPICEGMHLQLEYSARMRLIDANITVSLAHSNTFMQLYQETSQQDKLLEVQYNIINEINHSFFEMMGVNWKPIVAYCKNAFLHSNVMMNSLHYNYLSCYPILPVTLLSTPTTRYFYPELLSNIESADALLNYLSVSNDYQYRLVGCYLVRQQEYGFKISEQEKIITQCQQDLHSYREFLARNFFWRPQLLLTQNPQVINEEELRTVNRGHFTK